MFCTECGAKGVGKFCGECGRPLAAATVEEAVLVWPADWADSVDYETLLTVPEVRDRIARSAVQSPKRMSGEKFLELCDKALGSLVGGVPLATVSQFAQPLYAKLGVKTGKSRCEVAAVKPGAVIASVLCSLARHGRQVRKVHQLSDGCIFEATLASDMWSFAGDLIVTVSRQPRGTLVEAEAVIKGQLFDWGKSRRALEELFVDLAQGASAA
jgi:hypothetical protein